MLVTEILQLLPGSMSEGSVVVQYSTDGGLEWMHLHELVPDLYRTPRLVHSSTLNTFEELKY